MAFNLLGFKKTVVAEGLKGKIIMVYGGNNLGKTKQGAQFNKPVFFPFEDGLEAEGDVPTLPVYDWSSFKEYNQSFDKEVGKYFRIKDKILTVKEGDEKIELEKELAQTVIYNFVENVETIIFDTVTALDKNCAKFIKDGANVKDFGEVAHGKLYKTFEDEFYDELSLFLKNIKRLGLTVVFLAHEDEDENGKKKPKGNWKRVVKPIIDRCSIIIYLESNGKDENDKVIPSSGYLAETDEYFARIKWDEAKTKMEQFSAKNLEQIVIDAIGQQKKNGVSVGSHEDQQRVFATEEDNFEEIQKEIGKLFVSIYKYDNKDENGVNVGKYQDIVKEYLGVDEDGTVPKIKEAKPKQVKQLKLILNDIKELHSTLYPDNQ